MKNPEEHNDERMQLNFEQCFRTYLKLENTAHFYHLLRKNALIENIIPLIEAYGNETYAYIKKQIKHREDDQRQFNEFIVSENPEALFDEIQEGIKKAKLNQFENFIKNYQKILKLLEYFYNFEEEIKRKGAFDYLHTLNLEKEFADFREKANKLQQLLASLNSPSIASLLAFHPLLNPEEKVNLAKSGNESIPAVPHNKPPIYRQSEINIVYEPDSAVKVEKRSRLGRMFSYIKNNPKKIILGTLLGAGGGAAIFFLWPFIPALIVGMVLGAIIGGTLVGLGHYIINKKEQDAKLAYRQVPVDYNEEERNLRGKSNTSQKSRQQSKILLSLEEAAHKEHLIRFICLINPLLMPGVLKNHTKQELVNQLRSLLITTTNKDIFETIKNYLLTNSNIYEEIDIDLVVNICKQNDNTPPLFLEKHLNLDDLKSDVLMIKRAFFQFKKEENIESDLIKLDREKLIQLKQRTDSLTSPDLLYDYFRLLNKKESSLQLLRLISDAFPKMNIQEERNRIRNVLFFFMQKTSLEQHRKNLHDLTDEDLLEGFLNGISRLKNDEVAAIYLELISTTSPISNNHFFIKRFIDANPSYPGLSKTLNSLSEDYYKKNKSLFNCVHLFLNAVSPVALLPIKLEPGQEMLKIYQVLDELEVSQVVKTLSEIRFNTFIPLDLLNFQKMIENHYQQKSLKKYNEFCKGISSLNLPQNIVNNINPLLAIIRKFLSKFILDTSSVQNMNSDTLLPLLIQTLKDSNLDDICSSVRDILIDSTVSLKQINFFSQFLYNYFDSMRRNDLNVMMETLRSVAVIKSVDTKLPCGKFAMEKEGIQLDLTVPIV